MKTVNDVAGYISECGYYEPCPICYGCRNAYKYCSYRCDNRCAGDKKQNICTSPLHYPANFEKIISRPRLDLDAEGKAQYVSD